MATTAADVLIDALCDWGVEVIFGLPGDGINGLMEALRIRQDTVRFVQVRHEEAAAFMACGYAKYTGKLGVCLVTSGPGGIHLLNGLYDAKCDLQPIDFAAFARTCGATGFTFDDPAACGPTLEKALATPGPVIVDAIVDPFEPPMPPKVTLDQATKFAQTLAKGQPHRGKIALTVLSDKVRELI